MALTKAKVSFLEGLDGAVLTGAMPALDGSSLTGIAGMTKVTSDPALNTNPSSGVGTLWVNKSSGEMFVCKDATSNNNVWVNIGGGSGDVGKCFGGLGGGTVKGWQMGGAQASVLSMIQSYPYASNANASNVATLQNNGSQPTGNSSATHGYKCGGSNATIDKFTFSTSSNAAQIGTLVMGSATGGSCSVGSKTHGYICGGFGSGGEVTNIDKVAYASDGNSTAVGILERRNYHQAGSASATHGYNAGGQKGNTFYSSRVRMPMASDSNMVDIGDMARGICSYTTGETSETHGYISGGVLVAGFSSPTTSIEKYSFSSDISSINVAELTVARIKGSSSSSTTNGYHCGGHDTSNASNVMDKFPFASDTNATDIGDMNQASSGGASAQF